MEKHVIINIGRQFGSGGKQVAEQLGRQLGIEVFDTELISKAAEKSGISASLFTSSDEKKDFLKIGTMFGGNRYYSNEALNSNSLFKIQSETIREIALKGNAIFVGRASDYVLRDFDCCLNIFITAPKKARIRRIGERLTLDAKEAWAQIQKKDKSRKQFYDFVTMGDNWGVAGNYDLCIDSSLLGIEKTAELIIHPVRPRNRSVVILLFSQILHEVHRIPCDDEFLVGRNHSNLDLGIGSRNDGFAAAGNCIDFFVNLCAEISEIGAHIPAEPRIVLSDTGGKYNQVNTVHLGNIAADKLGYVEHELRKNEPSTLVACFPAVNKVTAIRGNSFGHSEES